MATDPIKHVIVLMLESRSFDHILGGTQKMRAKYDLSGANKYGRKSYRQQAGAARQVTEGPIHETKDVLIQLGGLGGIPPNGGFVQDYAQSYPQLRDPSEVMRYHDEGTLPAIHALAGVFTICDTWFSSVPGPTWANRYFLLSGSSLGRVEVPPKTLDPNQPTIFDRLAEKRIFCRVYVGDQSIPFPLHHPDDAVSCQGLMQFYRDAAGDSDQFPSFAFIEPNYVQSTAFRPPVDILENDVLVARVYNALRANDRLWTSSLLIVLAYDHGGFFDHIIPPLAIPPDHYAEEYTFDRYGVRVPAVLISPYVGNGIFSDLLDHTSLLKYLQDKWSLNDLGDRTAKANTFHWAISGAAPRVDTPLRISSSTVPAVRPGSFRNPEAPAGDAISAVYEAIENLIASGKRAYVRSVPMEAENILKKKGAGATDHAQAAFQVRAAIAELVQQERIAAYVESHRDWLIIKRIDDEVSVMVKNANNRVFIVHGHDGGTKESVARFVERLGFEAVILHERPNRGRTIISKFREEAENVGFAVVLMTPDDVGKAGSGADLKSRARQNVVFELGFFIGALGSDRVAAMVKGNIERPSDFDGVVYISIDEADWRIKLGGELKAAGFQFDWNKVIA